MMNIDERDVITRTEIEQRLKKGGSAVGLTIILFLPLILMVLVGCWINRIFVQSAVLSVILGVIVALMIFVIVFEVVIDIVFKRRTKKDKIIISEDKFSSSTKERKPRNRRTSRYFPYETVVRFASGKTYVLPSHEDSATRCVFSANHAKEGEVFYLVTRESKPDDVLAIYSSTLFKNEDR